MAVLTREMAVAVERLRVAFDPEEIILFGSRAYGWPRPNSDVDLLLVLRTAVETPAAREQRAREALGGDGWRLVDGHIWAYTPSELHERLRRGDMAVRDALTRGEVLFPGNGQSRHADLAGEWSATGSAATLLEKARDDLADAEIVLETRGARRQAWWLAAFHGQQAVEKAFKALIYHLGGEPERTHSLSELGVRTAELDPGRGRRMFVKYEARLAELQQHAVQPRDANLPPVSEAEARTAVETARSVVEDVTAILGV